MSHTAKIKVEFRDPRILKCAVEHLGGRFLGEGAHLQYGTNVATGHGFTLPGWAYPLALSAAGEILFDEYRSTVGKVTLDRLKATYAMAAVEKAAQEQGWQTERDGEALLIHHPEGGVLRVLGTEIDATGFQGEACLDAILRLGPMAGLSPKPEFTQARAGVQQTR